MRQITQVLEQGVKVDQLEDLRQRKLSFEISSDHCSLIQDYSNLVHAIASKIPNEYQRPIIDLKIYFGPKNMAKDKTTIGVLGGMGPLSDANLIRMLVNQMLANGLSYKHVGIIHLLSLPPPRSTLDQISGGPSYAMQLANFVRRDYAAFFLASNTAHVYLDSMRIVAGNHRIANLTSAIAKQIASHPSINNQPILTLGTTKSWENDLYGPLLEKQGLSVVKLEATDQARIQEWIDRIKTSPYIQIHQAHILFQEILLLTRKYGTSNVLLGCTELPLGLANYLVKLEQEGLLIFDTEQMFADQIAQTFSRLLAQ